MARVKHVPTFTTPELLEITGLTRSRLQQFEEAGLAPLRKGRGGRGYWGTWSVMQAAGAAYGKAFIDAGCHHSWAYAAANWVASQHPGVLVVEFARGRTLLALLPTGEGRLVEPYLSPQATRQQRLTVVQLDLEKCYQRVWRRAMELAGELAGGKKR
jgi:hypothetical protein